MIWHRFSDRKPREGELVFVLDPGMHGRNSGGLRYYSHENTHLNYDIFLWQPVRILQEDGSLADRTDLEFVGTHIITPCDTTRV
jgi:hypothetical protein